MGPLLPQQAEVRPVYLGPDQQPLARSGVPPVLAVILAGHLPQNLNVALHGFNLEILTEEAYKVRFCIELALQGMSSSDSGGLDPHSGNLPSVKAANHVSDRCVLRIAHVTVWACLAARKDRAHPSTV